MFKKSVTLVTKAETKNSLLVAVDKFSIVAFEGCTQADELVILAEFVQMATGERLAGDRTTISKNKPEYCSLKFVDASDILKRKLVEEAVNLYKEVREI